MSGGYSTRRVILPKEDNNKPVCVWQRDQIVFLSETLFSSVLFLISSAGSSHMQAKNQYNDS